MQGLVAPIAISSLVALVLIAVIKVVIELNAKGDDAMENKKKKCFVMILDILYTMSANLAGGALLAKALQPQGKVIYNSYQRQEFNKRTAVDCRSLGILQRRNDNESKSNQ